MVLQKRKILPIATGFCKFTLFPACFFLFACNCSPVEFFIEAESFSDRGGWIVDNQSMAVMGSPYLMAHGLGTLVEDASTVISLPESGEYRIWVRTRDWVKQWEKEGSPGRFMIRFNGVVSDTVFGTKQADWLWQDGGTINLKAGGNRIALCDLTGFNGRCDAIYLTTDHSRIPPDEPDKLAVFREQQTGLSGDPEIMGEFDLVVAGGGIAGCCAAISAARLGCKVALIQNRPVLGGNNSSEVRVGLSGLIHQQPYPNLGNLLDEIGGVGHWTYWEARQDSDTERSRQIMEIIEKHPEKKIHNAGPESNYEDVKKQRVVENEKNITLFLNTEIYKVHKKGARIISATGKNICTGEEYLFKGNLFADCTGDGNLGFLAGADFRMGREAKNETGEPRAPEKADQLVMGASVQWYAEGADENSLFPECPWAVQFNEQTCHPGLHGDWDWETGMDRDQITEIEYIRDYGLRAVFGNWDFLKNRSGKKELFADKKLVWAACIGGKRESRRLLGDILLKEQDILEGIPYEDASFTTTWGIDLHYPREIPGMAEEPFRSYADVQDIKPCAVPYRCLYSRNIDNMFMAGRNISVTHVALGTVRVMRTGGMMGEVVGMAASLCMKYSTNPRQIYQSHLSELKILMEKGVGRPGFSEIKIKKLDR
ncbi:MAG: FAD-dependent oxidoreductase [Bacteroidales bacterium]|nr:FAD-dependent oxidoreductase [Bacteroidales bacterium]